MEYNFSGVNLLGLSKPVKPVEYSAPEMDKMYLHSGENVQQYDSFMDAVNDLAQAFKFLPANDQLMYETGADIGDMSGEATKQMAPGNPDSVWGQGMGTDYSNLNFSPSASDWDLNLSDGVDGDSQTVLQEINDNFSWDDISKIGGDQSYYQIAKSGISDKSDEYAFDLMASMLESREKVMDQLNAIFGAPGMSDQDVIKNISTWLSQYTDVDPHNIGVLKMFFSMETDFINTVDAFMNCQTYWGGDSTKLVNADQTDLGDFGKTLLSKVDNYINNTGNLNATQKAAALELENMWTSTKTTSVSTDLTYNSDSNVYDLGQTNIDTGSEQVYVNGNLLVNTDPANPLYYIDYSTGKITLNSVLSASDTIKVEYTYTGTGLDRLDWAGDASTGNWTGNLTTTPNSWVQFFWHSMSQLTNKEAIRAIVSHMLSDSEQRQYKIKEDQYEAKKADMIQDEQDRQKAEAKKMAENKKLMQKRLSLGSRVSKAARTKKHGAANVQHKAPPRRVVQANKPKAAAHVPLRSGASASAVSRPVQTPAQRKHDRRVI